MGIDFELLLVLATLLTGIIYFWDRLLRRAGGCEQDRSEPWWIDLSRSLFPVILIVLIIRSFMVEPFRIPSGSMIPTLLPGDFILVNKFSYGIRLPVLHTEVVSTGRPERGDVAVFRYPEDQSQDYIKRVIGLPGDTLRYVDRQLFINDTPVRQEGVGTYERSSAGQLRREELRDHPHDLLVFPGIPDRGFEIEVPMGEYFVMGDNRDRSSDSRYWGTVPEENLVGEAFLIWMSWNSEEFGVNWERLGSRIR